MLLELDRPGLKNDDRVNLDYYRINLELIWAKYNANIITSNTRMQPWFNRFQ